jgi:hypothetical protein
MMRFPMVGASDHSSNFFSFEPQFVFVDQRRSEGDHPAGLRKKDKNGNPLAGLQPCRAGTSAAYS